MPSPLTDEIVKKLRILRVGLLESPEELQHIAQQIEATGAFAFDGRHVVPIGNPQQMQAARSISQGLLDTVNKDFCDGLPASAHPLQRAEVILQTHGLRLDSLNSAWGEGDDEFMGVNLSEYMKNRNGGGPEAA